MRRRKDSSAIWAAVVASARRPDGCVSDAEGEAALTQAILGVRARRGIVIVIAHRPSAIAGVDLLLAMKEGRAVAFGPKDEVLAKVLQREQPPRVLKVVPEAESA